MSVDEKDLVKAGADAALAPLKDFINKLAGPFADELGGILGDRARTWRFKQAVRLVEKVKRICEETGFEPKAVPLKSLLPILENASLEEDEDLHDRWANLLANAGAIDNPNGLPAYVDILRQLSATEVWLLDALYEKAVAALTAQPGGGPLDVMLGSARDFQTALRDERRLAVLLNNVHRLGLLHTGRNVPESNMSPWFFTALGFEFVRACRRPRRAKVLSANNWINSWGADYSSNRHETGLSGVGVRPFADRKL